MNQPQQYVFDTALVGEQWEQKVRFSIDSSGMISDIEPNINATQEADIVLAGSAIPGMPNLHSHAHQRAMAGLSESAGNTEDSFWTWRRLMYQFASVIEPDDLKHIASQLYLEMLQAGYTHVAEFQYLHHAPDGKSYANPAQMSLALIEAAAETGIGLTLLPVLYQYAGFEQQPLEPHQQRFGNMVDRFDQLYQILQPACAEHDYELGLAAHSLRAVSIDALHDSLQFVSPNAPIHIHIAEQQQEIDDCIATHQQRPVEFLFNQFEVNSRWCLVHATHMNKAETTQLASSGAVAGLCPTTEANLGDGIFNTSSYLKQNGVFGIGSDSHCSVSVTEELRWLEYAQRLQHQQRNVCAERAGSTGQRLFLNALRGGTQACGLSGNGQLTVGAPATFLVLDDQHPLLYQRSGSDLLDSWIFSGNQNPIMHVFVKGKHIIQQQHSKEEAIKQHFRETLNKLNAKTS